MTKKLLAGAALAALAVIAPVTAGLAGGDPSTYTSITSSGPLDEVVVGKSLTCQVFLNGRGQIYNASRRPADCRTYLAMDGGGATSLEPVSQTGVTGEGTRVSPLQVTTVVSNLDEGVTVTQTDSYVVGDDFWTVRMTVQNTTNRARTARLYRYWDCMLGSNDSGYGFKDLVVEGSTGCSITPNNSPSDLIQGHVPFPAEGPSMSFQAFYRDTRYPAERGEELPNTCRCNEYIDNGATIGWDLSLAPGASVTRTVREVFSPIGDLPNPDALPGPGAQLEISPGYHDFGGVEAGRRSDPETFRVTNVGTAALLVNPGGITLGGDNPGQFRVTGGTCDDGAPVAPGGSCTVTVVFSPTRSARSDAQLRVATTAGSRQAEIAGRAPNFYDAIVEAEKKGGALESIRPAQRVTSRGTRVVRAVVSSRIAAQGDVVFQRCLNKACTQTVRIASRPVEFVDGNINVSLRTRPLRPGRYRWVAATGPSEVQAFITVRAGAKKPVPVVG